MAAAVSAAILLFGAAWGADDGPREHLIEIRGFQYQTLESAPRPGDTVTWINRDIAPHTATATDESWTTPGLKQGERASITVTQAMETGYYCRYHPAMRSELPAPPGGS